MDQLFPQILKDFDKIFSFLALFLSDVCDVYASKKFLAALRRKKYALNFFRKRANIYATNIFPSKLCTLKNPPVDTTIFLQRFSRTRRPITAPAIPQPSGCSAGHPKNKGGNKCIGFYRNIFLDVAWAKIKIIDVSDFKTFQKPTQRCTTRYLI